MFRPADREGRRGRWERVVRITLLPPTVPANSMRPEGDGDRPPVHRQRFMGSGLTPDVAPASTCCHAGGDARAPRSRLASRPPLRPGGEAD